MNANTQLTNTLSHFRATYAARAAKSTAHLFEGSQVIGEIRLWLRPLVQTAFLSAAGGALAGRWRGLQPARQVCLAPSVKTSTPSATWATPTTGRCAQLDFVAWTRNGRQSEPFFVLVASKVLVCFRGLILFDLLCQSNIGR